MVFNYIFKVIGLDRNIIFNIISKLIQTLGGVITLFFIAKYLTKIEQGYFYTFGSILAVQIFFELGLSGVITQFVAHENADIDWNSDLNNLRSNVAFSRLSSLLHLNFKWFGFLSIFLFITLLVIGFGFFKYFGKSYPNVDWHIPWVILSINTSIVLFTSPILAFLEGLGKIKEVSKFRIVQSLIQIILFVFFFLNGFKLFAVPIANLLAILFVLFLLKYSNHYITLKFIWNGLNESRVSYFLEIFPFQWKIAISWISGYFIFQIFNPVIFATEGPTVAGQMGMTLTILSSIYSLLFSWISTKVPIFSMLIAKKKFNELDDLFNKTLLQSSLLNVVAISSLLLLVYLLNQFRIILFGVNIADRFLPMLPFFFMSIPFILNHIIGSWATYLRCHKKEVMLFPSIVMGILCFISTVYFGKKYGIIAISFGYMILTVLIFVWTFILFKKKKNKWHTDLLLS